MAQRTHCLYGNQYIGIESIFTCINGKQINIPEKVESLRYKGRKNQLFCPCGCGSNLVLVAGDRNLREQHFRLKEEKNNQECHLITEGKTSIDSKIVLKCWLDDKLKDPNIECRVPINEVDESKRKYEYTLLSRNKAIAICYSYDRLNLSDEKFKVLERNSRGINIIYIVDAMNGGIQEQYPEYLMKIQTRQGYCLFLEIDSIDYDKAEIRAVFYVQNIDGLWIEKTIVQGKISDFEIDRYGNVFYKSKSLSKIVSDEKDVFNRTQEQIKKIREKEEFDKLEREKRDFLELAEKRKADLIEKQKLEEENKQLNRRMQELYTQEAAEYDFEEQGFIIKDSKGSRLIQCVFCKKIGYDKDFGLIAGRYGMNKGLCKDCEK